MIPWARQCTKNHTMTDSMAGVFRFWEGRGGGGGLDLEESHDVSIFQANSRRVMICESSTQIGPGRRTWLAPLAIDKLSPRQVLRNTV
jgi:hypothetical protein